MRSNPFTGFKYFVKGMHCLTKPGYRKFIIIPLIANLIIFSGLGYLAYQEFDQLINSWLGWIPGWLDFIVAFFWALFFGVMLMVLAYSFTVIANLVSAPFNSFLAEKIERDIKGEKTEIDLSFKAILAIAGRSIARELTKIGYYLPRAIIILIITFIPMVNIVAPVLWFLFGAWMMAIQYSDYCADNNQIHFDDMRKQIRGKKLMALGFGSVVMLAMMVPVVNIIVMSAAVAGSTIMWLERYETEQQRQAQQINEADELEAMIKQ